MASQFSARFTQVFCILILASSTVSAALIDVWRADDLNLNDGDSVATWNSASNRIAGATTAEQPVLRHNATPGGGKAVRFSGTHRMTVANSPVGGRTAFSVAIVFKAAAAGANDNAQWWGKTGLVDAEEPGVTADWGTVITETGQVGIGTGSSDLTTYSTGASVVGTNYHVALFTWGGGTQRVHLDDRSVISQSGASTVARNGAGISFGGIHTAQANRRLNGDLVEIRFYDNVLSTIEASNVVRELTDTHVLGNLPRIKGFSASTNQIFLGDSATLSWDVTNATSVVIDNGIGAVGTTGSTSVSPTSTTTYTLTATNANGTRTASVTVSVDPGVPVASGTSTNTPRNTPVAIVLKGSDPNGGALTYSIVTPPAHGSLSGSPPNVIYTPAFNYDGLDSFTFKVNDGTFDSLPATVSIKVIPPPTAPTGIALSSTNIPAGTAPGGFVSTIRAIDPNEEDTHTFSLVSGFGDNNKFSVNGNVLSAAAGFAGGPGSTFSVRLRTTDNTGFSVEQTFTLRVVEIQRTVVINEVHYNGPDNTVREHFIELYNASPSSVDLSQWRLRGGLDYFIPNGTTLGAGEFLVIAENPITLSNRYGVAALGPWDGGLNNEGEEITLRNANNSVIDRVEFRSEFPWPIAANGEGASMQLVHPDLDNDLGSSWRSGVPATPGGTNVVFANNAAPNIRQVEHSPQTPGSSQPVTITCKVTDPHGIEVVKLAYQLVAPGQFIPARLPLTTAQLNNLNNVPMTNSLNPAFEAETNWTTVFMHDDGLNGDAIAGDDIYSVTLSPQANRTLVRYRITVADDLGTSRRAPFEDDPSLNFAYFVYDGVPAYGAVSSGALQTLPVYTLITRDPDINQCAAWFNTGDQLPQNIGAARNEGRLHFNWEGAVVYDNVVYDHVRYRLRGANGRYHSGKRSFRIRFNDGRYLEAKDQQGNRFPTKWRELTTGKGQSNRGSESFALNEVVNYFLWRKVGVPAPFTFHFHFRVIRGAQETPADQFAGDFWGLNWAQEKYDVRFLDSHNLPKGNLYKLVDNFILGVDERRYQGPSAVTNAEDFFNIENNLTGFQSTDWLLAHANYTNWYRYFTIAEAIRHYDTWPSANKNGAWYFEPLYGASNSFLGRAMQLPYDGTDTWGPTWNNGEDLMFNGIFPSSAPGGDGGQNLELQIEYRNVVREIRALLFQPDQINSIIDAHAGPLSGVAPADYARWRNAPTPASYGALLIPSSPGVTGGLNAYAQDMKNFMFVGGNNTWWIDRNSVGAGGWVTRLDTVATDTAIPARPTISYVGAGGYPVDDLRFQSSAFNDPQGAGSFGAIQWRVAEVLPAGTVVSNTPQLRLEWDAAWTSDEIRTFNEFITVPSHVVKPDLVYRVRARHKDNTGRWSQWSPPVEFRPGPKDLFSVLKTNLVFGEIMYNPPSEGDLDGDEFEYLELKNIGSVILDLSGLSFSSGINFDFSNGTRLAPGAIFLLGRNREALTNRYPGSIVHGIYTGRLNNDGETLTLSHNVAGQILSLTYGDRAPWPVTADGYGFSLVRDAATGAYRASAQLLGNPGVDGGASALGGVVINEALSSSTLPLTDSIELLNISGGAVNISGWFITDDPSYPWKYQIPARPALAPGEFAVFDEEDFNPTPGVGLSFSLSSLGDDVYLFSADGGGQLTGFSHGFSFGAAQDGVSFGRYLNSIGEEQFPLQIAHSFGLVNTGPRVGPVVISEIHYNPKANADEFLELRNTTASPVPLFDPAHGSNTWKVNGIGFNFPENTTLPANGIILLVSDNPTAFRARFGVPESVAIFQYEGGLQDSGENLEIQAPDAPTTNGLPYYAVDAVRYNDRKPWPLAADGAGASLQRTSLTAYGNDPAAWLAATPTPGAYGVTGTAPVVTSQPVSRTNSATTSATFSVAATGTAPLRYQWRFNGGNLDNETNATLLLSNVQLSDAGVYQAVIYNGAGGVDSSNATLVVRVGPTITAQPTNAAVRVPPDANASPTNRATFSVAATTYNPPITYQWQYNGADIPGATSNSYSFTNATINHEGTYRVLVSDSVGVTISQPATFSGLVTPQLTLAPVTQSVVTGAVVSLSAAATGNPLPFGWEWRRGASTQVSNTALERFSFFAFTNANSVGSTQQYRVVVRNLAGVANVAFNIITLADTDGDGLPDAWEDDHGFSKNDPTDRNLDADGDGAGNWHEYTAGTNPTNAASYLRVQLGVNGAIPTLQFGAEPNKSYTIQYSDVVPGEWQRLTDVLARATARVESAVDPAWTTNRFYRVVTPKQ